MDGSTANNCRTCQKLWCGYCATNILISCYLRPGTTNGTGGSFSAFVPAWNDESQVSAEIHQIALAAGGDISFPIIAIKNGQNLHNHYHGIAIYEGNQFLIDAGFENPMCYAGDLSTQLR